MSLSFLPEWEKLDPVECGLSTRSIPIRPWWCRGIISRPSSPNYGGGGETSLRNGLTAIHGRSGKTHVIERVESTQNWTDTRVPWEIQLISNGSNHFQDSHRTCTSSVWLTLNSERESLRVSRNHHHIFNCKFLQNTIWIGSKFLIIIANCYISCISGKYNATNSLGKTPKDIIEYMGFLGGRTSDTANGITSLRPTNIWPKSENNSIQLLKEKVLGVT